MIYNLVVAQHPSEKLFDGRYKYQIEVLPKGLIIKSWKDTFIEIPEEDYAKLSEDIQSLHIKLTMAAVLKKYL